jgi:hypothetical protein
MTDQDSKDSFPYSNLLDADLHPELNSLFFNVPLVGVPGEMVEFRTDQSARKPEPPSISSTHNSPLSCVAQSFKYSSPDQIVKDPESDQGRGEVV